MVAWTTKIVKGSFFKLQSSWDGASKLKKMAFAIRWCVGIFQAFDVRFSARSSTKAGPIDDHSDFAPFAASSANTHEGKYGGGARHKVESTRVLLCCPCFGKIVTVEGLAEERDSERTRETTHAFSRMSNSATQCAATLQGKRPLQKGTDVYHDRKNFERTGSCTTT